MSLIAQPVAARRLIHTNGVSVEGPAACVPGPDDSPPHGRPDLAGGHAASPIVRQSSPRTRAPSAGPIDLRRRNEDRRAAAALCVERAAFLEPHERALVMAVFRDGMTVKEVAALEVGARGAAGGGEPSVRPEAARLDLRARALRKRLHDITARLASPKFEFVASFLEPADQAKRRLLGLPCWPPLRRRVAAQCVIHGRSMRDAAAALGVSLHAIRRELAALNALFEARQGR